MLKLTPRGEKVAVLTLVTLLTAGTWAAGAVGNSLTRPVEVTGEGTNTGAPEADPKPPRLSSPHRVARPVPVKASRSRPRTATGTPLHLSCTCYVATGNRTASGEWPTVGGAASNLFPLGTVLRVETVGLVRINDRVGHSSDLDLFYSSRSACLSFGRRSLAVEVVRRG